MPSFLASAVPRDPEALVAAWIGTLVAATRDRCPYSRADGICSSYSYVIKRTRRIIREVEKMRQVNQPQPAINWQLAGTWKWAMTCGDVGRRNLGYVAKGAGSVIAPDARLILYR